MLWFLDHLQASIFLCWGFIILTAQDVLLISLLMPKVNRIFSLHRLQFLHHKPNELSPLLLLLIHPPKQVLNNIQHHHPPRLFPYNRKGRIVFPRRFHPHRATGFEAEGLAPLVVFHCVLKYRRNDNRQWNKMVGRIGHQKSRIMGHLNPHSLRYSSLSGQLITFVVTLPPPTIIRTILLCRRLVLDSRFVSCSQAFTSVSFILTLFRFLVLEEGRAYSVFWLRYSTRVSFLAVSRSCRLHSLASEEIPVTLRVLISSLMTKSLQTSVILVTCSYL